ncbi:CatA-like O-acetyltransferase [Neisseria sp. Ec49-e6-T10]|uniref:CatA-like O-acetyltransferase n=1 Tax=Neisseria sp. Ec49-e6-T10 TaxID=3140744 RepID=UPI003EBEF088
MNKVCCSYSMVVNIDITKLRSMLKELGLKAYPTQIYILSCAVNHCPEFKMSLDQEGRLGYWDTVNPLYTTLNQETETFSSVWTAHSDSFEAFYKHCIDDINQFCTGSFAPQQDYPVNIFTVSSIPWVQFSAFNINVFSEGTYLRPIFTIGKYIEDNGKILMPLAIQIHHAVCDGLHIGKFIENVQLMINSCETWLPKNNH